MLAEFLADQGDWTSVMPGARACLFSLDERPGPLPLQLEHLHFETLFCLRGSVTGANVDAPLEGVLVAVDARGARESLKSICNLLGGLTLDTGRVRRWMASQGGCAVVGPTHWSRAVFADLDSLPKSERARWCVWKSVELLYLLSTQEEHICSPPRRNRRGMHSQARCRTGTLPGNWRRHAGTWKSTWTSLSPSPP